MRHIIISSLFLVIILFVGIVLKIPFQYCVIASAVALILIFIAVRNAFTCYLIGLFLFSTEVTMWSSVVADLKGSIFIELVIAMAILLNLSRGKSNFKILDYQTAGLLLFFIGCVVSGIFVTGTTDLRLFKNIFVVVFLYLSTILIVNDIDKVRSALKCLFLGTLANSIISLFFIPKTDEFNPLSYYRSTSLTLDANSLSMILIMAIPSLVYFWIYDKSVRWRIIYLGGLIVFLVSLLFSSSRMGLVLLLFCLLAILASLRKTKVAMGIIFLILVFSVIIPKLWPERVEAYKERAELIGDVRYGYFGARTAIFATGLQMIHESPLIGLGFGSYAAEHLRRTGDRHSSHNSYISIPAEMGLPSLLLYLSVFLSAISGLLVTCKRKFRDRQINFLSKMVFVSICVFLISGLSIDITLMWWGYVYLALIATMNRLRPS